MGDHAGWVVAKIDGVSKPGDPELESSLAGKTISFPGFIIGEHPVGVQCDSNYAFGFTLEFVAIGFYSSAVGYENIVGDKPRLSRRIANRVLGTI